VNEPPPLDRQPEPDATGLPPDVAQLSAPVTDPISIPDERRSNARNLYEGSFPAVLLIGIATVIYLVLWSVVVPSFNLRWMFEHAKRAHVLPEVTGTPAPKSFLAVLMAGSYFLVALAGFGAAVCALVATFISKDARKWLERSLLWLAERPLPAIHLLDVVAIFLLYASLHPVFVILLHRVFDFSAKDMITPALMLGNDLAMGVAIFGAIGIARYRARGEHGTRGFWPPWSGDFISPARPIWHDVLIGLACFPLALWLAMIVGIENKFLVNAPDKHFIIAEFASHPRLGVALIYIVTGTLGAAFFEEILFRGILYNSMRRFMGARSAALSAAFIFAYVHGLKSDLLGLFVLGLAMTWLYDKTGRLVAGMVFHFTNNFVSLILTLALYNQ